MFINLFHLHYPVAVNYNLMVCFGLFFKVDDDSSSVSGSCETKNIPFVRERKSGKGLDPELLSKGSKSAKLSSEDVAEQRLGGKAREKRETPPSSQEKLTKDIQLSGTILVCIKYVVIWPM